MRAAVFIDGSNFYHACRDSFGRTDVDIGKFAQWLVGPSRDLVRTYYYTAPVPPDRDQATKDQQARFFGALARIPYLEVRFGRLAHKDVYCGKCGQTTQRYVEKGVDMHIGVDMLSLASKGLLDVAILVSGDADLADAVRAVKELGKHVELGALASGRSWELVQVSDVVREISARDMEPFFLRKALPTSGEPISRTPSSN